MNSHKFFISLLLLLFFPASIYSLEEEILNIDDDIYIDVTKEGRLFKLMLNQSKTNSSTNFLAISTTPEDFMKPAFIYVARENSDSRPASPDYRGYSSQEIGKNIIYIPKKPATEYGYEYFSVFISSLEDTKVRLQAYYGSYISLEEFPQGFKHRTEISQSNPDIKTTKELFRINKGFEKTKKVLFYILGERTSYFYLFFDLCDINGVIERYDHPQRFENGYGTIVEITPGMLGGDKNVRFRVVPLYNYEDQYKYRKVDISYEIIDNIDEPDDHREVNIWEHVYGVAEIEHAIK